jgi:hypothetical protein
MALDRFLHLPGTKLQDMAMLQKDFSSEAFSHTNRYYFSVQVSALSTFQDDPSIAGSFGIPSSQSVASELPSLPELSPFPGIILSPTTFTRNLKQHNRKNRQPHHLTSEENIKGISEEMRSKIERKVPQKREMRRTTRRRTGFSNWTTSILTWKKAKT